MRIRLHTLREETIYIRAGDKGRDLGQRLDAFLCFHHVWKDGVPGLVHDEEDSPIASGGKK